MVVIPKSSKTVNVSIIDTGATLGAIPAEFFIAPHIAGFTTFDGISYVFLISHTDVDGEVRRVLFDLGARKDWENMVPFVVEQTKAFPGAILETVENVGDILEREGIAKSSIEAIVWRRSKSKGAIKLLYAEYYNRRALLTSYYL